MGEGVEVEGCMVYPLFVTTNISFKTLPRALSSQANDKWRTTKPKLT
jgi:hypothetical protein